MIPVTLHDVLTNAERGEGFLLLSDTAGRRALQIFVGTGVASLVNELFCRKPRSVPLKNPRPQTYTFLASVLQAAGAELVEVQITELVGNAFRAVTIVRANGVEHRLDSRPSDAVPLAVCMNRPITVAESLMEEAGVEIDGDGNLVVMPDGFCSTRAFWGIDSPVS